MLPRWRVSIILPALAFASALAWADTVYLKNGKSLEGEVVKEDSDVVVLKLPAGEIKLKKSEVEAVERQTPQEYRVNLGRRLLQSERYDAAVQAFQEAYLADKTSTEAKRMLASALWIQARKYRDLNRIVDSRSALENLLKLDPNAELLPHTAVKMLQDLKERDDQNDAQIELARKLAADGSLAQALQLYDRILQASPDSRAQIAPDMAQCHVRRANKYAEDGNLLNAAGDLESAMRLDPKLGDSLERGYCGCVLPNILANMARGDLTSAQLDLKRCMEFCPNNKYVLYVAGRLDESLGKIPSASAYYAQALGTRVGNPTPAYLAELRKRLEVEVNAVGNKFTIDTSAAELTGFANSSSGPAQKYETDNFIIYHYNEALAREAGNRAEGERNRVMGYLGLSPWVGKAKLYLHRTHAEYTAKTGLPEWTGGVTKAFKNGGPHLAQMDIHSWQTSPRLFTSTLPHEITHVFVSENVGDIFVFPRCLNEGIAVLMEPQYHKDYYMNFLRLRMKSNDFIPLAELLSMRDYPKDPEFFYGESYALIEYLVQTKGVNQIVTLVKGIDAPVKVAPQLMMVTGARSMEDLEAGWKGWITKSK